MVPDKEITQTFSHTLFSIQNMEIIARNDRPHTLTIGGTSAGGELTTDEMRDFGNFLIETASKIEADKDFN